MPASLIQRQKSSAKEEMVTPRVRGAGAKFEPDNPTLQFSTKQTISHDNPVIS